MKYFFKLLISLCLIISAVSCNENSEDETVEIIPEEMPEIPRLIIQPGNEFLLTPVGHITKEYSTPEHLDHETVRAFIFVQSTDSISVMREYQQGRNLNYHWMKASK